MGGNYSKVGLGRLLTGTNERKQRPARRGLRWMGRVNDYHWHGGYDSVTACANNATAKRKGKRRKEGRETPCVSTFPHQRRLLQASGPHPAEGLCWTIARSLNERWLSSSCAGRELGEQQWPSSLAPAPRELTSTSRRGSTSNTTRAVRIRQRGARGADRSRLGETRQCRPLQGRAGAARPRPGAGRSRQGRQQRPSASSTSDAPGLPGRGDE